MVNNEDLIKELGLDTLPEEKKEQVIAALSQSLQNRITVRVLDTMSDVEKKEAEKLIKAGDDNKVGEYIASKVPGLESIAKDELEKMRTEMLSANEGIKEAIAKAKK